MIRSISSSKPSRMQPILGKSVTVRYLSLTWNNLFASERAKLGKTRSKKNNKGILDALYL